MSTVWMCRRAWATLLVVALTAGLLPVVGGGPGRAAAATAEEPTAAAWTVGRVRLAGPGEREPLPPREPAGPVSTADATAASTPSQASTARTTAGVQAPAPARRPGEELVERRSARVKVVAGSAPGRVEARVYAAPVHFRDSRGGWVEIDPTLVPAPGGRLASRANAFGLSLAADAGDRQLARVELGGGLAVGFGLAGGPGRRGARVTASS